MRHLAAVLLTAVLLPATASAADRHAATDGSGSACTTAAPCSVTTAVNGALAGDTVLVRPGTYGTADVPLADALVAVEPGIDVRSSEVGVKPVLYSDAVDAIVFRSPGGTIRDLAVRQVSTSNHRGVLVASTATATRLDVRNPGGAGASSACTVQQSATLSDSLCVASSQDGTGLMVNGVLAGPNNVLVRNVTAIANGPVSTSEGLGNAISVTSAGTGAATRNADASLVNVVASGSRNDIYLGQFGDGTVTLRVSFSAYDDLFSAGTTSVIGGATNTTADPQLDPTTFGPLAGSPLIDAGDPDGDDGRRDLLGNARTIGARPDVGAIETTVAPVAGAPTASGVSQTGAGLSGTVDPRGSATTYRVEYGPTTAYGSTTPTRALDALDGPRAVRESLAGLLPGTTYHARLVATNGTGTATSDDVAFTTNPVETVTVTGPTITVPGPTTTVTVTVPAPTPAPTAPETCTVPKVKRGATLAAAKKALAKAKCPLAKTTTVRSKTVKKGRVVRLTVAAGRKTAAKVGVVVSRG